EEAEIFGGGAAEIARLTQASTLAELGAGSANNTRLLLDALEAAGTLERFVPLDVSGHALQASAETIAAAYPRLAIQAIVGDFERDLGLLPRRAPAAAPARSPSGGARSGTSIQRSAQGCSRRSRTSFPRKTRS